MGVQSNVSNFKIQGDCWIEYINAFIWRKLTENWKTQKIFNVFPSITYNHIGPNINKYLKTIKTQILQLSSISLNCFWYDHVFNLKPLKAEFKMVPFKNLIYSVPCSSINVVPWQNALCQWRGQATTSNVLSPPNNKIAGLFTPVTWSLVSEMTGLCLSTVRNICLSFISTLR